MSFGFGVGDFIAVFNEAKKFRDSFKDAPKQLEFLGREVISFAAILEHFDRMKGKLSDYEFQMMEAPAKECSKLLVEAERLRKEYGPSNQRSTPNVLQRIKFKPEELSQLRGRISLNVQFLEVIRQFKDSQLTLETNMNVKSLYDQQMNQQEQEILEWLDLNNYEPQYQSHLSRRREQTGEWFVESSDFNAWVSEKGRGLLCHGVPGSGKTVMSSIVINHLSRQFQCDGNTGIAYIFCDAKNQEDGPPHRYVSNLAKQLAKQLAHIEFPAILRTLYEKHQTKQSSRGKEETVELLLELAASYTEKRLFIIIDGLDECSADVRDDLIENVSLLQQKSGANILLTTRPIPEITDHERLCDYRHLELQAHEDDIRRFISSWIPKLKPWVREDTELQEEIKKVILERADGTFLLAELMVNSIRAKLTRGDIRRALKSAPQKYADYYRKTWDRIQGQDPDNAKIATKVILWIVCAKRPLRMKELQHALAEGDDWRTREENIPSEEGILSICLGLVRKDAGSNLRLVHQTAVEYFEGDKDKAGFFPDANAEMATVCMRYLSFEQTQQGAAKYNYEMDEKMLYPDIALCQYAAVHWGNTLATLNSFLGAFGNFWTIQWPWRHLGRFGPRNRP